MSDNPSDPRHDHPISSPTTNDSTVGRITDVRNSLGQATMAATELGDQLAAALTADDQQRLAQTTATGHAQGFLRASGGDHGSDTASDTGGAR
jgi:hypothetical protein